MFGTRREASTARTGGAEHDWRSAATVFRYEIRPDGRGLRAGGVLAWPATAAYTPGDARWPLQALGSLSSKTTTRLRTLWWPICAGRATRWRARLMASE